MGGRSLWFDEPNKDAPEHIVLFVNPSFTGNGELELRIETTIKGSGGEDRGQSGRIVLRPSFDERGCLGFKVVSDDLGERFSREALQRLTITKEAA